MGERLPAPTRPSPRRAPSSCASTSASTCRSRPCAPPCHRGHGFLHSFTTGSAVDGPGIRVVAWTSGCMWRCRYCHNPDTWTIGNGIPVTIARATEELRKYRHGLKALSGGFTLSGGEPLMQHRFAVKLFAAARALGIHTALDTNGYYGDRLSDAELEMIDLVLLDVKGWDEARHRRLTGMEIGPTLEFARRLAARKKPVWLRFVLVPALTDDPQDSRPRRASPPAWATWREWTSCPSTRWASSSGRSSASQYKLGDAQPPSAEAVGEVCAAFRKEGLNAL